MSNISSAIQLYIDNEIRLSQRDLSESAKSRDWMKKRIEDKIIERYNNQGASELVLHPDKFLHFGSYFKGTKVKDVDEYDILVLIDSNSGQFSQNKIVFGSGQGQASPNPKYNRKYFKEDGSGVSPKKTLIWLQSVIADIVDSFNGVAPERDGQAITATIKSHNLKIDFVPAGVFTRKSDGLRFYNIPMGDVNDNWILTAPEIDMNLMENASKNKENFKNIIRICKKLNISYNLGFSSFAVETAIINSTNDIQWNNQLYIDLVISLKNWLNIINNGLLPDPFDNNINLLKNIENLDEKGSILDKIITSLLSLNDNQDELYLTIRKLIDCNL